jgi:hypothetical protein
LSIAAIFAGLAGLAVMNLGPRSSDARPFTVSGAPSGMRGVSIMAYNIEGLPWPFAAGRPQAFAAIEQRLRHLRSLGEQPHVLVLEEAFTPSARAIGAAAGYRSVVVAGSPTPFGSGLEIASNLPILDVKRFTYDACAGLDCLAAKGAMLATVALPKGVRIQIAATHLNSHRASGSDDSDANQAYFAQVDELSRFILANRDPKLPLLVVGDFNTYPEARRAYLMRKSRTWKTQDTLDRLGVDVLKGKDRQFFASGGSAGLTPVGITVPFGRDMDGTMLSNHVGYVVHYRLDPAASALHKA